MRTSVSIITGLGLTAAVWGAVLTTDAQSARQSLSLPRPEPKPLETVPSDTERRARLEARIADWARSERKPVLRDDAHGHSAQTARRSAAAQPLIAQSETRPDRPARQERRASSETHASATSTIAPPPSTSSYVRTANRGYRPPRLDLVNTPRIPTDPVECLTQAIYYEARNESEEGQAAVAEVVINRSRAGNYPRDICQVVYQRNSRTCQFTFTCDGSIGRGAINMGAWARAERIAREVHSGRSGLLPATSVNYHANYVRPSWGRRLERVRQIGAHIFYGAAKSGHATPGSLDRRAEPAPARGLQFVRIEALDRAFTEARTGIGEGQSGTTVAPSGG